VGSVVGIEGNTVGVFEGFVVGGDEGMMVGDGEGSAVGDVVGSDPIESMVSASSRSHSVTSLSTPLLGSFSIGFLVFTRRRRVECLLELFVLDIWALENPNVESNRQKKTIFILFLLDETGRKIVMVPEIEQIILARIKKLKMSWRFLTFFCEAVSVRSDHWRSMEHHINPCDYFTRFVVCESS
jgi:hypothetical protein